MLLFLFIYQSNTTVSPSTSSTPPGAMGRSGTIHYVRHLSYRKAEFYIITNIINKRTSSPNNPVSLWRFKLYKLKTWQR